MTLGEATDARGTHAGITKHKEKTVFAEFGSEIATFSLRYHFRRRSAVTDHAVAYAEFSADQGRSGGQTGALGQ